MVATGTVLAREGAAALPWVTQPIHFMGAIMDQREVFESVVAILKPFARNQEALPVVSKAGAK
jgi:hypothetical protein